MSGDAATGNFPRQSDIPTQRGAIQPLGGQGGFPPSSNSSNVASKNMRPTHAVKLDQHQSESFPSNSETLQENPRTPLSNRRETSVKGGNLAGSTGDSAARMQQLASVFNKRQPEATTASTGNVWSSLSRKQQPGKSNGTDFFGMFDQVAERAKSETPWSSPNRRAGHDQMQLKSQDVNPNPSRPAASGSQAPSRNQGYREQQKTAPMASKGVAASNLGEKEKVSFFTEEFEPTTRDISKDQLPSPPSNPSAEKNEHNYRSKRSNLERDDRFEMKRGKEQKGGKKRAGRSSKYDEGDGMDDSYDDYQERRQRRAKRKAQRESERAGPQPIMLPELISISNLASALKVEKKLFLEQLGELGFEGVSLDSIMAGETAALVAQEYGFEPSVESGESEDLKPRPPPEDPSVLPPRPPVVTIMGHVDHGKTTLLDYLRKSSVAAQEHGGITQHIGAFSVKLSGGKQITFLDTPGHAAFLTMRQRGANVTDIVVLVVAADDSVKPQTLEALKHARSAKVPMIVAINKIDKDTARIDQVKADLARNGVEIEDYGGDVQVVCVSGKTGQGMDDLEENILALSEIIDMRAEYDSPAEGWILESSLKPIGKAATILVKRGTLRPGDYIAAGTTWAKIRHLRNEAGAEIAEAPPGTPVEILGWRDLPAAGDQVIQGADEGRVRRAVEYREGLREREQDAAAHEKISEQRRLLQEQRQAGKTENASGTKQASWGWGVQEQVVDSADGPKIVNFVVKGDVHGSVEAVCACIQEIGSHEVRPRILRSSPGQITESDVEHAATSGSAIVNFNLSIPGHVKRKAEQADVKILNHTVIYHLSDDVKDHLSGHLGVDVSYQVLGEAEVLQIFPINVRGRSYKNIAGCKIRNGRIQRNDTYRVFRGGEKIFEGKRSSFYFNVPPSLYISLLSSIMPTPFHFYSRRRPRL
jgi:translation initiation factor IF-2